MYLSFQCAACAFFRSSEGAWAHTGWHNRRTMARTPDALARQGHPQADRVLTAVGCPRIVVSHSVPPFAVAPRQVRSGDLLARHFALCRTAPAGRIWGFPWAGCHGWHPSFQRRAVLGGSRRQGVTGGILLPAAGRARIHESNAVRKRGPEASLSLIWSHRYLQLLESMTPEENGLGECYRMPDSRQVGFTASDNARSAGLYVGRSLVGGSPRPRDLPAEAPGPRPRGGGPSCLQQLWGGCRVKGEQRLHGLRILAPDE